MGGRDTFVFASGTGHDQIMDFEQGKDRIDLTGYAGQGIHAFGDLTITPGSAISSYPDDTASSIVIGANDVIVVHNMPSLVASDFVFA